jgi:15-cis-phytoene synthase
VYLPEEDLQRFGVTRHALLQQRSEPGFLELMRFEAQRAREFFAEARAALPSADRKNLLPAEIMRTIYENILNKMEEDGFQSLTKEYTLNKFQKILCSAKVLLSPTKFTASKKCISDHCAHS